MGDRGFVIINGIGIYTHWGAHELERDVARALNKGWRYDDHSYLAHIVFDELNRHSLYSETGIGIGPAKDNYGPRKIIKITNKNRVIVKKSKLENTEGPVRDWIQTYPIKFSGTFAEFIEKYYQGD